MEILLKRGKGYTIELLEHLPAIMVSFEEDMPFAHDTFREHAFLLLDEFVVYSKQFDQLGVIIDARRIPALSGEDVDWFSDVITRSLAAMQVGFVYHVVSQPLLDELTLRQYVDGAGGAAYSFPHRYYTSLGDALVAARQLSVLSA